VLKNVLFTHKSSDFFVLFLPEQSKNEKITVKRERESILIDAKNNRLKTIKFIVNYLDFRRGNQF
jgi:hypothetical protein